MASQVHPGGIWEGGVGGGGVEKALCFQPGASEGPHCILQHAGGICRKELKPCTQPNLIRAPPGIRNP